MKSPPSPVKTPHVDAGESYAADVAAGRIPSCKWVRLACERHLADRQKPDWTYAWEPERAERVAKFVELFPHTKGKWAARGVPFQLEPWQCFMVGSIFGWVYRDGLKKGTRRFRRAMLLVPRKNGKSDFAARLGLAMFALDREFGAEVYSGATTEVQAWEVFRPARLMAERTPAFLEHFGVQIMKSNLSIAKNGSRFQPVIGKPGDGASPSCAIIDEYHEHLDDTLVETMETGMVAREQPLTLIITTAGDNLSGPCYALAQELEKILAGVTEHDQFWGIIYTIDDGDDWTTDEALRKANPNYGVSVDVDRLQLQQLEAIQSARKQGTFQTKHLNVWVGARQAFFNMHAWMHGARGGLTPVDCKGGRLFVGLDLASTRDIAAVVLLFEKGDGRYATFGRFYLPGTQIEKGQNSHYAGWSREGRLILTDGGMIDYSVIEADILALHAQFGITELGFDPAYAQRTIQTLMAEGIPCVEVRPTVLQFSAPMKHLDGLILSGKLEHDGDPCFSWQMSNVVSKTDAKDNVYPVKERVEAKIDGAVALIMACNRAMAHVDAAPQYQMLIL